MVYVHECNPHNKGKVYSIHTWRRFTNTYCVEDRQTADRDAVAPCTTRRRVYISTAITTNGVPNRRTLNWRTPSLKMGASFGRATCTLRNTFKEQQSQKNQRYATTKNTLHVAPAGSTTKTRKQKKSARTYIRFPAYLCIKRACFRMYVCKRRRARPKEKKKKWECTYTFVHTIVPMRARALYRSQICAVITAYPHRHYRFPRVVSGGTVALGLRRRLRVVQYIVVVDHATLALTRRRRSARTCRGGEAALNISQKCTHKQDARERWSQDRKPAHGWLRCGAAAICPTDRRHSLI